VRIPIPAVVVPVIVVLVFVFVPGVRESPWTATRILGAILALVGYVLAFVSRVQLGKSFTVMPEARELVTHGLYSRLRNPIYVFVDLLLVGLILALALHWLFAVLGVVVALQAIQARREARVLQDRFGQAYVDYRKRTWF
jgi:protein-S-isoprenylcysteine O-methyltransferase Ste14